jgi:hypothetical protein
VVARVGKYQPTVADRLHCAVVRVPSKLHVTATHFCPVQPSCGVVKVVDRTSNYAQQNQDIRALPNSGQ